MSGTVRAIPDTAPDCHEGMDSMTLTPPPALSNGAVTGCGGEAYRASFHTPDETMRFRASSVRLVPPTAVTHRLDAGNETATSLVFGKHPVDPRSPLATNVPMPATTPVATIWSNKDIPTCHAGSSPRICGSHTAKLTLTTSGATPPVNDASNAGASSWRREPIIVGASVATPNQSIRSASGATDSTDCRSRVDSRLCIQSESSGPMTWSTMVVPSSPKHDRQVAMSDGRYGA